MSYSYEIVGGSLFRGPIIVLEYLEVHGELRTKGPSLKSDYNNPFGGLARG